MCTDPADEVALQEELREARRRQRRELAAAGFATVVTLGAIGSLLFYVGVDWSRALVSLCVASGVPFFWRPWRNARDRVLLLEMEAGRPSLNGPARDG